jgi:hypothetical protein
VHPERFEDADAQQFVEGLSRDTCQQNAKDERAHVVLPAFTSSSLVRSTGARTAHELLLSPTRGLWFKSARRRQYSFLMTK